MNFSSGLYVVWDESKVFTNMSSYAEFLQYTLGPGKTISAVQVLSDHIILIRNPL